MKKWDILNNIKVEKLVFGWKWFARHTDWRVIFIIWWVVPWSIINLRILKSKKDFIETQVLEIVKQSPIEKIHPNNPYGINGWCKRVNIPYQEQLKIKEKQVKESFFHIEKLIWKKLNFSPIVPSPLVDWYRNKVEFSFWKYISEKEQRQEHFNLWFHKQWQFSKIEDIDWFILIKEEINKIFREIKKFTKNSWLPAYDQKTHEGFYRHLVIRNSHFADEIMIILGYNPKFLHMLIKGIWNNEKPTSVIPEKSEIYEKKFDCSKNDLNFNSQFSILNEIKKFFHNLAKKYPNIKSIYLSSNDSIADISIWELEIIYGKDYIVEEILWLRFNISPKSFFQTNSYWAEVLYNIVKNLVNTNSKSDFELQIWTILDLYAWTWTIGMILSSIAKDVYSVELVKQASQDWEKNAKQNWIKNIKFVNAKVEDFLKDFLEIKKKADLLIIDPPRAWMHPSALPNILKFNAQTIIYVSCNPATLARDLEFIIKNSNYEIIDIIPVDMFPHTHHIETVVKLKIK